MKKLLFFTLLLLIGLILLTGCSETADQAEQAARDENGGEEEVELPSVMEQTVPLLQEWPFQVTDQVGRVVTIEDIPQSIVSLSPSNTEMLFALGLGDRVTGVTEFCNYPAEALEKPKVGGFNTPSIERIVEIEPDLVLASTIHEQEVPFLEELGLTVLVVESSNLHELYSTLSLIAEVAGDPLAGEELIAKMTERISAVETALSVVSPEEKIKVYYEVYSDPLMSAGSEALINEIIALAGGINIFGDVEEKYPTISAEVVAERQPQIIIFPDYHGSADIVFDEMASRPGWENIPAVLDNRIYAITDDSFVRPGPRVVEAVEEAARLFYPDLF